MRDKLIFWLQLQWRSGNTKGRMRADKSQNGQKKYRIATITVVTTGTCLQSQTGLDKMFYFCQIYRLNLEKVLVVVKCGDFLQLS